MRTVRIKTTVEAQRREAPSAPRSLQTALELNGVVYLPHYTKPSTYVGPGYTETPDIGTRYSTEDLLGAGATPCTLFLWGRASCGHAEGVL